MHPRDRNEFRRHLGALAVLGSLTTIVLLWFSSPEQIGVGVRYLLGRPATLVIALLISLLIGTGVVLLVRSTRAEPDQTNSRRLWVGRLPIWITVLSPLVIGAVWWAFFSEGDA